MEVVWQIPIVDKTATHHKLINAARYLTALKHKQWLQHNPV